MPVIYVTSDLHFNHDREFIWKPRGFSSVQEMNETIIERFNKIVRPVDDLYILGDLCLGDLEAGRECISRLNGRIHVVYGNHDTDRRKLMYSELPNVVEHKDVIRLRFGRFHFYMSHYPTFTGNIEKESLHQMECNLYGHTHQKSNFYQDFPFMYHVGVDSHDCCPIILDHIIQDMYDKVEECKRFL